MSDYGLTITNNYWAKVSLKGDWPSPLPDIQEVAPGETKRIPYILFNGSLSIPRTTKVNITNLNEKKAGGFSEKRFGVLYQCDRLTCELRFDDFTITPIKIEIGEWGQVHITTGGDGDICLLDRLNVNHIEE